MGLRRHTAITSCTLSSDLDAESRVYIKPVETKSRKPEAQSVHASPAIIHKPHPSVAAFVNPPSRPALLLGSILKWPLSKNSDMSMWSWPEAVFTDTIWTEQYRPIQLFFVWMSYPTNELQYGGGYRFDNNALRVRGKTCFLRCPTPYPWRIL